MQDDARNELIACLLWTDLHVSPLRSGLKTSWPAAALDRNHELVALSPTEGVLEVRAAKKDGELLATMTDEGRLFDGPLQFDPSGTLLAAGIGRADSWELLVWDWKENRPVVEGLPGVHDVFDFHPDGSGFALGTGEGELKIYGSDGAPRGASITLRGVPLAGSFFGIW